MLAIFLDQEATGLDPAKHHVIEIALKVFNLQTGSLVGEYESIVKLSQEDWDQKDPVSIQVNEFTWEMIQSGKSQKAISEEITKLFTDLGIERDRAVFICQNPAFDRAFFSQLINVYVHEKLNWPYHWLDLASMYWMMRIQTSRKQRVPFPETMNLSKDTIAQFHSLPPENKPHRAMNGVNHLIECYDALVGIPTRIGV